ncbi:hypothetical protein BJ138DRAFT_379212 [Hygrophoropsis aurantiaca]|uniref:Uncharacterized protein n=1 Tax=Hygrophoropsis aurantiaca TaxID=72124 RepID=A0ACB8A469_9AGAM|nr:hypothetical protein BJ138DRAFT_379212 [Hygrophoropsis aurantiaca]
MNPSLRFLDLCLIGNRFILSLYLPHLMASPVQAELELLYQYLTDSQTTNYVIVASVAALVYDSILIFQRRYRYIWKGSFSIISIAYLILRYGYITQIGIGVALYVWPNAPLKFCQDWFQIQLWTSVVLLFPLSVIMAMRTYALYGRKYSFKIGLTLLVVADNLTVISGWILASKQVIFTAPIVANSTCILRLGGVTEDFSYIEYGTLAGFDAIIFLMTLFRCIQLFRTGQTRLIRNIFHDSLMYFTIMVSMTTACLAISVGLPESRQGLSPLLSAPLRAVNVTLISRMVLNLRQSVTMEAHSVPEYSLADLRLASRFSVEERTTLDY